MVQFLFPIRDMFDKEKEYSTINIVCKYNNKMLTKNQIITGLASLKDLASVDEV